MDCHIAYPHSAHFSSTRLSNPQIRVSKTCFTFNLHRKVFMPILFKALDQDICQLLLSVNILSIISTNLDLLPYERQFLMSETMPFSFNTHRKNIDCAYSCIKSWLPINHLDLLLDPTFFVCWLGYDNLYHLNYSNILNNTGKHFLGLSLPLCTFSFSASANQMIVEAKWN